MRARGNVVSEPAAGAGAGRPRSRYDGGPTGNAHASIFETKPPPGAGQVRGAPYVAAGAGAEMASLAPSSPAADSPGQTGEGRQV